MFRQALQRMAGLPSRGGVRYFSRDITGANIDLPPWAKEKLMQEGYTEKQIRRQGWENLTALASNTDGPKRSDNLAKFQNIEYSMEYFRKWRDERKLAKILDDQTYNEMMEKKLGAELAAAKFLIENEAAVKFFNRDEWIDSESKLKIPDEFRPDFMVEAIDMRDFKILRRGFENLGNLEFVRSIKVCNLDTIDDWCIDFISGSYFDTLQFLDVSGCPNVTERGLSVLHRCKRLEKVYAVDMPNVGHGHLIQILLEEALPNCEIIGFDYWKSEEAQKLVEETRQRILKELEQEESSKKAQV